MHLDARHSVVLCSFLALTHAFYIPGFSFKSYRNGETIPLLVNKIYSDTSELQYAYTELPFVCPPTGRIRTGRFTSGTSISLNLGEVLRGDRIVVSDYELIMGMDQQAKYLCNRTMDMEGIRRTKQLIRDRYVAEWIVDNLPGATSFQSLDKRRKFYAAGFKIGEEVLSRGSEPRYFINNHVTVVIRYHQAPGRDGARGKNVIVGFEVFPKSISADNRTDEGLPINIQSVSAGLALVPSSNGTDSVDEMDEATLTVPYTYSVYFREEPKLEWKNRWDMYFVIQDDNASIHWLAIINSLVISGLLTAVVAVILARTVHGDIKNFRDDTLDEAFINPRQSPERSSGNTGLLEKFGDLKGGVDTRSDEETFDDMIGWKMLYGDVFRTPPHGELLASLIGSGIQLLFMSACLLILSAFGVLNPGFRGGYISVGIGLFVAAGLFSGYFSSRMYKTFGGQTWRNNAFLTASLVPGLLFATIFVLNLFVWVQASSTALPFGTLIVLVALWLFLQLPLVYIGGWCGYTVGGVWTHPIKANPIPRQIPTQPWHGKTTQGILLAGFIPFAVIFIELMFVFQSLWQDKSVYYYVFGFMGVAAVILVITVIEATIVATYVQLCSENYHWWWQSFLAGGSSSVWIFAYLVWYYFTNLHIKGFVSSLLFFCYGFLACAVYGLLAGSVGFLGAYVFVRRIYGAIKVD